MSSTSPVVSSSEIAGALTTPTRTSGIRASAGAI